MSPPLSPRRCTRGYLVLEGLVLFGGVPAVLFVLRSSLSHLIIPVLVIFGLFCGGVLWTDPSFDRSHLWGDFPSRSDLRSVVLRLAVGGSVVTLGVGIWSPDLLLSFPQKRPYVWAALMVVYPLWSVYPQEVIFRAFLFHRYHALLPSPVAKVVGSTVAFGWGHVLFGNWTAPLLSAAGGLLFATTYARTRSLRLAAVEHALWGGYVFTVGLGRYFYSGALG